MTVSSKPRRSYHDFRHPKKAAFLVAHAQGASIKKASEAAGVDRRQIYYWLEHDPDFLVAYGLAKQDALESLEDEARRRAEEGVRKEKPAYYMGELCGMTIETEYSDTLMIFLLKSLAPEKYRERQDISLTGAKGLKIVIEDSAGVDVTS